MRTRELETRHRELTDELAAVRSQIEELEERRSQCFDPTEAEKLMEELSKLRLREAALSSTLAALERELEERRRALAEDRARRWREELLPKYHEELAGLEEEVLQTLEEARARYDRLRAAEEAWIAKWIDLGRPDPRPKRYSGRDFKDFCEPPPGGLGERERRLRRLWR